MNTLVLILLVLAIVLFLLSEVRTPRWTLNTVGLGLACAAGAMLVERLS